MVTVKQLLEGKGQDVWSVSPDDTVFEAVQAMADKDVGALMVLSEGRVAGVVSERDYARRIALEGRASRDTKVADIMTTRVVYALPSQTVDECLALMTDKRIRHLPVMDGDQLIGVLSIGDLVKSIIDEQRHVIEQLEQYIAG
ncbi:MAG: CBS domain-containing protein [Gammaproteobacteria bacterium]